jgi:hypothetical protein
MSTPVSRPPKDLKSARPPAVSSNPYASDGSTYYPSRGTTRTTLSSGVSGLSPAEARGAEAVKARISAAAGSFSDGVYEDYATIFSLNNSDTRNMITRLLGEQGLTNLERSNITTRFTDLLLRLTKIIDSNIPHNMQNKSISKGHRYTIILPDRTEEKIEKIAGGTYGSIFKSGSRKIYKRVSLEGLDNNSSEYNVEKFARETCLEVFIQTVLQNDSKRGHNIAHITSIYRDSKNRLRNDSYPRNADESSSRTPAPRYQTDLTFFFEMEPAGDDLYTYEGSTTYSELQKYEYRIMEDLGNILAHFDTAYGFRHRDLHPGNVLISDTGQIKLIDFGKSCINVKGVTYSVVGLSCASDDLFLFLSGLLQFAKIGRTNSEMIRIIRLFLTYDPRGKNLNVYDEMLGSGVEDAFHLAYPNKYITNTALFWADKTDLLYNRPNGILRNLQPARFAEIWKMLRLPTTVSGSITSFDHPPRSFVQRAYNCIPGKTCAQKALATAAIAGAGAAAAYFYTQPKMKTDGGSRRKRKIRKNKHKTRKVESRKHLHNKRGI